MKRHAQRNPDESLQLVLGFAIVGLGWFIWRMIGAGQSSALKTIQAANPRFLEQMKSWQCTIQQNGGDPHGGYSGTTAWHSFRGYLQRQGQSDPGDTPPPEFFTTKVCG